MKTATVLQKCIKQFKYDKILNKLVGIKTNARTRAHTHTHTHTLTLPITSKCLT